MHTVTSKQNRYNIKNSVLYIILWAAGCVVAFAIIFLWNRGAGTDQISIFRNLEEKVSDSKMSDNIVNELLLSANELNIYGTSSLIGYNAMDISPDDGLLLNQIKANPQNAYQRILKNKLNKLKQQQPSTADFDVKPVPK